MIRPALRYHGGKHRIAPWVISHFPEHTVYVEPYGGSAGVLLRKPRSYGEIYNDLDGQVVNVFRQLRDPVAAKRLCELVWLTPFSREEFELAYEVCDDPLEQARRTIFRGFAAHGSTGILGEVTGFRARCTRARATDADSWSSYPSAIQTFTERLRGVVLEQRPAIDVMLHHDAPNVLHYVDPPYVPVSRSAKRAGRAYRFEMTEEDHVELANVLRRLQGAVVLSGYPSELYESIYADWGRVERQARVDKGVDRTEVLWLRGPGDVELMPYHHRQLTLSLPVSKPPSEGTP